MNFPDKQKILKIFGSFFLFVILTLFAVFSFMFSDKSKDSTEDGFFSNSDSNDFSRNIQKSIDFTQIHNELQELIQQQQQNIQSKEEEINVLNDLLLEKRSDDGENISKSELNSFALDKEIQDLQIKISQLENSFANSEQLNSVLKERIIFLENCLNDEVYLKDIQQEQMDSLNIENPKILNENDDVE
ncbi:hypothetical protein [Candidatus Phytoplasma fraxini]|uniref:Sequence-variable mosaic (SVM) signal sequence domain-containing protein n=1 Tax=Ash yellows phytoplasma TaxID=35780 RepID=A0ABZ2U8I6_ASHYP